MAHVNLGQCLPERRMYLLPLFDPPLTNHQQLSVTSSTEPLINITFRAMTPLTFCHNIYKKNQRDAAWQYVYL